MIVIAKLLGVPTAAGVEEPGEEHLATVVPHDLISGFVERLPGLRLTGAPERIVPFNLWGQRRLPVAWG